MVAGYEGYVEGNPLSTPLTPPSPLWGEGTRSVRGVFGWGESVAAHDCAGLGIRIEGDHGVTRLELGAHLAPLRIDIDVRVTVVRTFAQHEVVDDRDEQLLGEALEGDLDVVGRGGDRPSPSWSW